METQLLESAAEAGRLLAIGRLVAFPTETVFGLGANILNERAVEKIFEAKGRPADNPLIVHIAKFDMWNQVAADVTRSAVALIEAFSPGPITVVLKKKPEISSLVTAGLDSVGIRVPSCTVAQQVLQAAGVPIAAPSANLSGRPSCTTWRSVLEDMRGKVDAILCKDSSEIGLESTVVDCRTEEPILLRTGAISLKELRRVVPEARAVRTSEKEASLGSPGLRHPHYQPRAKVEVIDNRHSHAGDPRNVAYIGMTEPQGLESFVLVRIANSVEEYSKVFYEFLRVADRSGAELILCEAVAPVGIGDALNDRMRRSAGLDG